MNRSISAYCQNDLNATYNGVISSLTFTGKERDEETGYGYFGARYMDHELMTMWLSVDPMSDKCPSLSPYNYCAWNPVKLVDPNGCDTLNFASSKFLTTQPDYGNSLIINAHGLACPPQVRNDNLSYVDDFDVMTGHNSIPPSDFANYLKGTTVFKENWENDKVTPIFLISCQTGDCTSPYRSFAQSLGAEMDCALIVAPVGNVHAKNGMMHLEPKEGMMPWHKSSIDGCYWSVIYEGLEIGRIGNAQAFDVAFLMDCTKRIVNIFNSNNPNNQIKLPDLSQQ